MPHCKVTALRLEITGDIFGKFEVTGKPVTPHKLLARLRP